MVKKPTMVMILKELQMGLTTRAAAGSFVVNWAIRLPPATWLDETGALI